MTRSVWLCETCVHGEDEQYVVGSIAMDGICARCGGLAMEVFMPEAQTPHRAKDTWTRPIEFTTCVAIDVPRNFCWDVNGYYRKLGVAPTATKREIREAYQKLRGWESPRLTYIVRILFNDELRARYDQCSIGSVFFDRVWLEYVYRKMQEDMARMAMAGGDMVAEKIDLDHLLDQPIQVVDRPPPEDDHGVHFAWGYYLWQSGCRDTERLSRWQEHLVAAFAERKETTKLAVGFLGQHMACPWESIEVGHLTVVFLNDSQQPTRDLANQVADRVEALTKEKIFL